MRYHIVRLSARIAIMFIYLKPVICNADWSFHIATAVSNEYGNHGFDAYRLNDGLATTQRQRRHATLIAHV